MVKTQSTQQTGSCGPFIRRAFRNRGYDLPPYSARRSYNLTSCSRSCGKVGNAICVFKVGGAHVFSIACLACEFCWCPEVQTAMWPLFVVVATPEGNLPPGVE